MRILLVLVLLLCVGAFAQDEDAPQRNTALVRQYPHLDKLLTRADTLIKGGRYRDALEIYLEAIRDCPNHVVPVPVTGRIPPSPVHYEGVLEYCLRDIGRWPEEGKAAYRAHFDSFAKAELEVARRAQDLEAIALVAERYPHSSYADDAYALLGNLAFDDGDPHRAALAFERLLTLPDAGVSVPLTIARLGVAYSQAGQLDALKQLAKHMEHEARDASIVLGDRETSLGAFLEELIKKTVSTSPGAETGSWECLQGNSDGTRVAEAVSLKARVWSAPIPLAEYDGEEEEYGYAPPRARVGSNYRPLFPAVADGIVYLHNEYQVWAFNLYAGSSDVLWTHRVTPPGGTLLYEERLAHTTTVHDGRVFATLVTAMGRMETRMQYIHVKFPFPKRALMAFDAYTGRVLWRLGGVMDTKDLVEGLSFPTSPTPVDGRLYVGAIRQLTNTDPFEHYVLCIDAATGDVVWQTFVASGGTEINLFGNSTRESVGSAVSVSGESVYYCTNHGAFASLDRRTGRLKWLTRYQQLSVSPTRSVTIRRNPLEWTNGAPIVAQDQVHFAPTDSRMLYALDAKTGAARWERDRGDVRVLYGIVGTMLVAGGDALEWYDVTKGGKLQGRFEPESGTGTGRGVVAADGIYFPATEGLYRVSMTGGRREFTRWPGGRVEGGNLVVAEGALLLVGPSWIDSFFDRRDCEADVVKALAENPENGVLLYRLALRLLQSGREEPAADLLAKVLDLTVRSRSHRDQLIARAARRRLYGVSLEAGRRQLAAGEASKAKAYFERAREVAPDPAGVAEATFGISDALVKARQVEEAIAEVQRLIAQSGEELVEGRRLAEVARDRIAGMLKTFGIDVYRRFEKEAEARLALARQEGGAESYLVVWRRWPNAMAAQMAVLGAAEAYERAEQPEEAAAALRLFLRDYPTSPRVSSAQMTLVKVLEKKHQFAAAAALVKRLLRQSTDLQVQAFCKERLAREEYRLVEGRAAVVHLSPPLKPAGGFVEREAGGGGLYVLRAEGPPLSRAAGILFVVSGNSLKGVRAETGAVEWKLPLEGVVRMAFAHDEALLICGERWILRVNPTTGGLEWRYDSPAPLREFAIAGTLLLATVSDPRNERVVALDTTTGGVHWTQSYQGTCLPGGLLAMEDRAVVVGALPYHLHVFDLDTGRRESASPLFSSGGGVRVLGGVEGTVVLQIEGVSLEAYDVIQGKLQWRKDLRRFESAEVRVSPGGVFVLGRSFDRRWVASFIHLRNGKLLAINEHLEGLNEVVQLVTDEKQAYVVSRLSGRSGVSVRGLTLADGTESWATEVPILSQRVVARLAAEHVVLFGVARLESGKIDFSATLLDKRGKVVQNIHGDGTYERQAGFDLANNALLILVDNRVEVHR